jgi:hypothetical protein
VKPFCFSVPGVVPAPVCVVRCQEVRQLRPALGNGWQSLHRLAHADLAGRALGQAIDLVLPVACTVVEEASIAGQARGLLEHVGCGLSAHLARQEATERQQVVGVTADGRVRVRPGHRDRRRGSRVQHRIATLV